MKSEISASVMCSDFKDLKKDITKLEKTGVEYIHFDVMDGHFVPNLTMGPDIIEAVRNVTSLPMDIHLMVENPERFINMFNPQAGDIVCVHQEATNHLQRVLQAIKDSGAKAGAALNPATPLETINYVLDDIDIVLVMTVNPGYAGQKLVPATLEKIADMKKIIKDKNLDIKIEVDGNVSFENARKMKAAGADIFVAGSSSIFRKDMDIEKGTAMLRRAINE